MDHSVSKWAHRHLFSILLTLIMGTLLIAAQFDEGVTLILRYDLSAIQHGQLWRILTGHLVHTNGYHALLNLAGLWIIAALFELNARPSVWLLLTLVMALISSLGFWWFKPEMSSYVGFSGVLHGLFFLAAISEWPRDRLVAGGLAAFLIIKLISAHFLGPSTSTEAMIGAPIAEIAHLLGAVQGVLFGWPLRRWLFLTWRDKSTRWVV